MWIYGVNPVLEAFRAGRKIKEVYISSSRRDGIPQVEKEIERAKIPVKTVTIDFFDNLFPKGHQGIAAKVEAKQYTDLRELLEIPSIKNEIPFFVVIDCIEDPRNLGAILRTADAAGVHGVVIQEHRSAGLGPTVSKTSAGADEHIPVSRVSNIKNAISEMKKNGITILGAEAGAGNCLWNIKLDMPVALVVGSEGKGLRKTVAEKCDMVVSLPMKGSVNSLNASVAAGILMFEILRQRMKEN